MKKQKTFRLTIVVTTSQKVDATDLELWPDDVVDGFQLSRNSRLGDITSEFHLRDAELESVEEVRETTPTMVEALTVALNYINDDIYHYSDIGDTEAAEECEGTKAIIEAALKEAKVKA